MINPQLLLLGAVTTVGVLHTIVPDHWVPIVLIARQRGWSNKETAHAALKAGTGHVVSTLLIAVIVWVAGATLATRFGHYVDIISSLSLIAFGGWIAASSLREMHHGHEHHHEHTYIPEDGHNHDHHHKDEKSKRTALLLILGSSPMIEGIPAFFVAGKYGPGLIIVMSTLFAVSTIATYVLLCIYSTVKLKNMHFGAFERYGEVLSGAFIAILGLVFLIWPVL
jgi:ABC-type nickel/cobalt efflux system permease component RcnA